MTRRALTNSARASTRPLGRADRGSRRRPARARRRTSAGCPRGGSHPRAARPSQNGRHGLVRAPAFSARGRCRRTSSHRTPRARLRRRGRGRNRCRAPSRMDAARRPKQRGRARGQDRDAGHASRSRVPRTHGRTPARVCRSSARRASSKVGVQRVPEAHERETPRRLAEADRDEPAPRVPVSAPVRLAPTHADRRPLGNDHPEALRRELVRVEVQDGVTRVACHAREAAPERDRRQRAPIGATAQRKYGPASLPDGDRELPDTADPKGVLWNGPRLLSKERRVEQARVVHEAELFQDVMHTWSLWSDREPRRAKADRRDAAHLRDDVDTAKDVLPELRRRLLVHAAVLVAVTSNLMASRDDVLEYRWVPLCRRAHDEEGGADVHLVQDVEDGADVVRKRVASDAPVLASAAAERELVPVLEVETEDEWSTCGFAGRRTPRRSSSGGDPHPTTAAPAVAASRSRSPCI